MDGPRDYHPKGSKPEKDNFIWYHSYVESNYSDDTNELIYKAETDLQILKINLWFSSVAQSCLTLCDPVNRSMPGLPVHHQHPEFTQTHVHRVGDAIKPSHPLLSPSPPAPNPSQHQSLFE